MEYRYWKLKVLAYFANQRNNLESQLCNVIYDQEPVKVNETIVRIVDDKGSGWDLQNGSILLD